MRASIVQKFIIELLQKEHSHFTAQEIYAQVKQHYSSVNPSTVYRSLERLKNKGMVSVSDMGTGAAVYEMVTTIPHHHLVCQGCHQVITLENDAVQPFFDDIEGKFRYKLITNHLILFGYCQGCQDKQE